MDYLKLLSYRKIWLPTNIAKIKKNINLRTMLLEPTFENNFYKLVNCEYRNDLLFTSIVSILKLTA